MAHIHTGPENHDFTVSAFIIRTDFDQPKIMLHVHKKLNNLLQFGGHVEVDENPWQAITHEILEESGYGLGQLQLLQPKERLKSVGDGSILHPQPLYVNTHPIDTGDLDHKHFHIDIGYAFVADGEPANELGEDESAEILLFTRDELLAIESDRIFPAVKEISAFAIDIALSNWDQIPASSI